MTTLSGRTAGIKPHRAVHAAASKADVTMSPASAVLSAARGLADAGISAAGLVTYADKSGR